MHLQKSRTQGLTRGRHAFYYLMIVLFFAFILANILPSGAFTRETVDGIIQGRSQQLPGDGKGLCYHSHVF